MITFEIELRSSELAERVGSSTGTVLVVGSDRSLFALSGLLRDSGLYPTRSEAYAAFSDLGSTVVRSRALRRAVEDAPGTLLLARPDDRDGSSVTSFFTPEPPAPKRGRLRSA